MDLSRLQLFQGPEHQPFLWPGDGPAALLIHGFPGTPADMRPLAQHLHAAGWTVHGLLLPGFGSQLGSLFDHKAADWLSATRQAVANLHQPGRLTLMVGYSMGGAVALHAVAGRAPGTPGPDGLVLLAPLSRLGPPLLTAIWQVLRRLLPRIQPFRRLNFANQSVLNGMGQMWPGLDLADPDVQAGLRQLTIPTRFAEEILRLGRRSGTMARAVTEPTCIIQGRQDQTIRAHRTRQLLDRFAGTLIYEEVEAGHDLIAAGSPALNQIAGRVLNFAENLDRAS